MNLQDFTEELFSTLKKENNDDQPTHVDGYKDYNEFYIAHQKKTTNVHIFHLLNLGIQSIRHEITQKMQKLEGGVKNITGYLAISDDQDFESTNLKTDLISMNPIMPTNSNVNAKDLAQELKPLLIQKEKKKLYHTQSVYTTQDIMNTILKLIAKDKFHIKTEKSFVKSHPYGVHINNLGNLLSYTIPKDMKTKSPIPNGFIVCATALHKYKLNKFKGTCTNITSFIKRLIDYYKNSVQNVLRMFKTEDTSIYYHDNYNRLKSKNRNEAVREMKQNYDDFEALFTSEMEMDDVEDGTEELNFEEDEDDTEKYQNAFKALSLKVVIFDGINVKKGNLSTESVLRDLKLSCPWFNNSLDLLEDFFEEMEKRSKEPIIQVGKKRKRAKLSQPHELERDDEEFDNVDQQDDDLDIGSLDD